MTMSDNKQRFLVGGFVLLLGAIAVAVSFL